MENMILGNRQPYTYNNGAISMQPVNSHSQGNAPPPLVRSAGGQNSNHMSNLEQTMLQQHHHHSHHHQQQSQQQPPPPQQQRHHHLLHHHNSALPKTSPSSSSATSVRSSHNASPASGNASSPLHAYNYNNNNNNMSQLSAQLAGAVRPATHSPGGIPQAPSPDFSNLAFWNQLTATQRLLLTQQLKNSGDYLSGAKSSAATAFPAPPPPSTFAPLLPLNAVTDLKSMLNYKPKQQQLQQQQQSSAQFTKPTVPPLLPMEALAKRVASRQQNAASSHTNSSSSSASASSCSTAAVPLNSSSALEDFEKKFKMTDEMKAVVQKVLSNPDLSTFIQTNSSNTFVPFISPPISPANTTSPGRSASAAAAAAHYINNSTSLSLVPNPNVTITPAASTAQFSHPASGGAHSPLSSVARQKSVICSTSAVTNVPPSPSTSASTPSPSPTRTANAAASIIKSHQQQQHHNHHLQQNKNPHLPTDVIDLSSPRRSLQAATAFIQQQQQQQQAAQQHAHQAAAVAAVQQQQRLAAAAQHHSQQNGRSGGSSSSSTNSASMHLQRHAALAADRQTSDSSQRLSIIPEIASGNLNVQPYKVQKVYVENQLVPCINMKSYNDSEQLMTLTDFQKYFFPSVALDQCKQLIETLGVELYKGNRHQVKILMENDRNHNENIPLVQVRDVIRYMTQLTFMIRNQAQPPTKRTRIS